LATFILSSDLLKIRLDLDFPERNHCVSRRMSVGPYETQIASIIKGYWKLTGYVRNTKAEPALEGDWM